MGELPEAHRGPMPMDEDPPSTSQENNAAQPGAQPANGKHARPKWKQRGLRVLKTAHTRPLDHQDVVQTMANGTVVDWDAWDSVVNEAVRCALLAAGCLCPRSLRVDGWLQLWLEARRRTALRKRAAARELNTATLTSEHRQGGGCREGLRVNFADHPVLLSESAAVGKDCREQVTERMFEGCGAPAIFLAKSAVLSAFALGRQTGARARHRLRGHHRCAL